MLLLFSWVIRDVITMINRYFHSSKKVNLSWLCSPLKSTHPSSHHKAVYFTLQLVLVISLSLFRLFLASYSYWTEPYRYFSSPQWNLKVQSKLSISKQAGQWPAEIFIPQNFWWKTKSYPLYMHTYIYYYQRKRTRLVKME